MSGSAWPHVRSRFVFVRRDVRGVAAPLASATKDGVVLRDDLDISVWNPGADVSNYKLVEPGDFVIGLRSFQHGISHSEVNGIVSPAYTVLRGSDEVWPAYFKYYFRSAVLISRLANITQGIRQGQAIDIEAFSDLAVPLPPMEEQRRIADFLDVETARIDALARVYETAAETIKERVQRLVDEMVEAGGSSVPLKYVVRFREGPGIMAADFRDEGTPLVRISGLIDGRVTLEGANFLDPDAVASRWSQFRLKLGDYVISGSATMGSVSIVADQSVVGSIPYTGLIILRPAVPTVSMDYVAAALTSGVFDRQIDVLKAGATMQHFGPTHLAQVSLPIPDLPRQRTISRDVHELRQHSLRATSAINRQLALLTERRQALITTAVTGQIDVTTARRFTPSESVSV